MAATGARRFPLPAQEQPATVVPEAAPAEKRRQQVSVSSDVARVDRCALWRKFSACVCVYTFP